MTTSTKDAVTLLPCPVDQTGWLIEEDASGITHWIALAKGKWPRTTRSTKPFVSDRYQSPILRVKDANKAIRFARKEDAEAFMELFDFYLLNPVVTEHCWPALTQRHDGDDVERVAEIVEQGAVAFALEAADELETRGKLAQSMLSAIPAIVAHERLEQHNAVYEGEARRWFRLADAVRKCVAALAALQPEGNAMCEGDEG